MYGDVLSPGTLPVTVCVKFPELELGVTTGVKGALPVKSSPEMTTAALAACEKAQSDPTTNAAKLAEP